MYIVPLCERAEKPIRVLLYRPMPLSCLPKRLRWLIVETLRKLISDIDRTEAGVGAGLG